MNILKVIIISSDPRYFYRMVAQIMLRTNEVE